MAMLLAVSALGLVAEPRVPMRSPAAAASSASMLFGIGKKEDTLVSGGTALPTKVAEITGVQKDELLKQSGTLLYVPVVEEPDVSVEPITEAEVRECQAKWAAAIKTISATYLRKGDYVGAAGEAAAELYGYGHSKVLFKPTKATLNPFRPTGEDAMSYFVGADAMGNDQFKGEDAGFAINGGKGWSDVVFDNHNIVLNSETATAMGSYVFTCATTGEMTRVEYTFGYKRCEDGKPRIYLHPSSVPYLVEPAPVTEAEVLECQAKWANAIKSISATYLEKGDFINAAADAAGELYGYGHTDVLFKPTKAAEFPFRPTGPEAMSYLVGADAICDDGYEGEAG